MKHPWLFYLLFLICLLQFGISANAQNIRKFERLGIDCSSMSRNEETMASDNEFNRVTICYGYNDDGHYKLYVYYHRGYFYNIMWGTINGCYSVNVCSTLIDSQYPIDRTNDYNYASFPTNRVIEYCKQYGIKHLIFYE